MLLSQQDLQFVETLAPRMQEAAEQLGALLRAGLADALRAGNGPARQHCLQAFAAVGDGTGAEQACSGMHPSLSPHAQEGSSIMWRACMQGLCTCLSL